MGGCPRDVRRSLAAAGAAAVTLACAPAGAHAATAGSDFTRLTFQAARGEANHVVFTWEGATVRVQDSGAALLLGCVPEGLNVVRCLAPSGAPPADLGDCRACTALIVTGDGDDSVGVVGMPTAGLRMRMHGGAGDDTLAGGVGADAIHGDAGADTATYEGRGEPLQITLDGTANDGAANEGDDVRTDGVTGGARATTC